MTAPTMRDTPDVTVITGAAGWLGTALLHAYTAEDGPRHGPAEIRAVVRTADEAASVGAVSPRVLPIVADVRESTALDPALDGGGRSVDVIHAAGVIHPHRADEFDDVNVGGTEAVLHAARRAGVRRLVHVSSNSPFGTNPSASDRFRADEPYRPYLGYGRSKMLAEQAVFAAADAGLDAVVVRPPWFYGPHQPVRQTTFFRLVRRGMFPVIGTGDQARSMVFVGNLVDGIARAQLVDDAADRAWWIADREPYLVSDIVRIVGEALRSEGYEVRDPWLRLPRFGATAAEWIDGRLQASGRYHQQLHVLGEMGHHIACDISSATDQLGYEPSVELLEGMRRSISWCRAEGIEL